MELISAVKILDTTTDAVVVINTNGQIQLVNSAVSDMFGYVKESLLGSDVSMLMPKSHADIHQQYIQRYLNTHERRVIDTGREVECLRKDGSMFFAFLTILEYHIDEHLYFAGVLRDVTDMKHRELELERKNRELSKSNELLERFAYISAHDLKTPLRSVSGLVNNFTRIMDRWVDKGVMPKTESVKTSAELIVYEITKMATTIDDTLRYCKAGQNLELSWCKLEDIVQGAIHSSQALIDEYDVSIYTENADIQIYCDGSQMEQVFYNLITNAIKYNDSVHKEIRISAYTQYRDVMIHVEDNGRGIPEDQQGKVFQLFQKLQNEGSGVGGAIIERIVTGHNGTVTIDSVVGVGSTFNIKLPIKDSL